MNSKWDWKLFIIPIFCGAIIFYKEQGGAETNYDNPERLNTLIAYQTAMREFPNREPFHAALRREHQALLLHQGKHGEARYKNDPNLPTSKARLSSMKEVPEGTTPAQSRFYEKALRAHQEQLDDVKRQFSSGRIGMA